MLGTVKWLTCMPRPRVGKTLRSQSGCLDCLISNQHAIDALNGLAESSVQQMKEGCKLPGLNIAQCSLFSLRRFPY